jgi:hypothetical protein
VVETSRMAALRLAGDLARLVGGAAHHLAEVLLLPRPAQELHEVEDDEERPLAEMLFGIFLAHPLRDLARARAERPPAPPTTWKGRSLHRSGVRGAHLLRALRARCGRRRDPTTCGWSSSATMRATIWSTPESGAT